MTAVVQVVALAAKADAHLIKWAETDNESGMLGERGVSVQLAASAWLRHYPVPLGHGYKPWARAADTRARAWRDACLWRALVREGGRELNERVWEIPAHELVAESWRMRMNAFDDVADELEQIAAYRYRYRYRLSA